jgi:SAM-dependent methyltransferase
MTDAGTLEPGTAYVDGEAWAAGPDLVYGRLAEAAVSRMPGPLDGRVMLDAGAGTGAMSRALRRRHARVVAADLSASMLRAGSRRTADVGHVRGVVADVSRLPFRADAFDGAVAGFVLSHVGAPGAVLRELGRVTRPNGAVLVSGFPTDRVHPIKAAVDAVLAAHGYRPPEWYVRLKHTGEARVGTAAALLALAADAGLADARVEEVPVELGGLAVPALAAWRLGMAQVTAFVSARPTSARRSLTTEARAAIEQVGTGVPVPMLVLHGQVSAASTAASRSTAP